MASIRAAMKKLMHSFWLLATPANPGSTTTWLAKARHTGTASAAALASPARNCASLPADAVSGRPITGPDT